MGQNTEHGWKNDSIHKLIPTNNRDVKEIYLGIDTQTKHIYNRTDVFKNGSKVIITVNSFKTNQALSKNHFTLDRKSTRLNSSHVRISYAVFCLKKKKKKIN